MGQNHKRCETCNAFQRENVKQGWCRALPPTPLFLGYGQSAIALDASGGGQPIIMSYFPSVRNDIACRMWAQRTDD